MTAVAASAVGSNAFPEDRAREGLAFVHKLLQESQTEFSLPNGLHDLTDAFAGIRAGLTSLDTSPVTLAMYGRSDSSRFPWELDRHLLTRLRNTPAALPLYSGASWLLSAVVRPHGGDWFLWLEAPPHRVWTSAEEGAFYLAAQALGRLACASAAAPWTWCLEQVAFQRRLELAAAIAGRLAHDFSNILTGILGFADLTLSALPAGALARPYVQEVLTSAQHGADWVRKLQVFSRRFKAQDGTSSLPDVLADEERRCREGWAGAVALLVAPLHNIPPVAVDSEALREMIRQLLDNARQAISERGVVTLAARAVELSANDCLDLIGTPRPGAHVEVAITDTGSGISPEAQRRLVSEMFFSTKNRQRGLGLPVIYACLSACHGGFRFGPHPAQGTAVKLFLPVAAASKPSCPTSSEDSSSESFHQTD